MVGTDVISAGIMIIVLVVFGYTTWQQCVRLRWDLKARDSGFTTQGHVVGARTVWHGTNDDRTTYYRVRFTTNEGRLVEVEDEWTGEGPPQGGTVIVNYHPEHPELAAVTSCSGSPSWISRMKIVAIMTPLTLTAAGVLLATMAV